MNDWRDYKKIELHRHLEGSVRLQTLIDIADEAEVDLPSKKPEILKNHALVLDPMKDLSSVLKKFWLIQSCLATETILDRITYENCVDAYNDGIRVLELRYSPGFINTNHPKLTYENIHEGIMRGAARAKKEHPDLVLGFICIISRDLSLEDATHTTEFAISNKDSFVGFDLAGDEIGYPSMKFKDLFQKVRAAGLGVTVHSGEARGPKAAETVKESIEYLGATRIGHGLQIINNLEIVEFVKKSNVLLELCPTSNYLTNAVDSLKSHPIKKLMDLGVKVSLNSDDPHLFGIDLTHEYNLLAQNHGFGLKEFDLMTSNALEFTFLNKQSARSALLI